MGYMEMSGTRCKRHGGDHRGSAASRRARKLWLLRVFGNGETCECVHGCGTILTFATLEQDRIVPGGPYRRENLQPSCRPCNEQRSNDPNWTLAAA